MEKRKTFQRNENFPFSIIILFVCNCYCFFSITFPLAKCDQRHTYTDELNRETDVERKKKSIHTDTPTETHIYKFSFNVVFNLLQLNYRNVICY